MEDIKCYEIARFCAENLEAEGEAIKKYEEMLDCLERKVSFFKEIKRLKEQSESEDEDSDMPKLEYNEEEYNRASFLLPKIEELIKDIREITSDEKNHIEKLLKSCRIFDNIESAID